MTDWKVRVPQPAAEPCAHGLPVFVPVVAQGCFNTAVARMLTDWKER